MYKCIIFDVDGTLINTEAVVIPTYQRVIFEEFGRYFTEEELARSYALPTYESIVRMGFKNVEEGVQKYHKYLMEAFCNVKAYDGIIEVLDFLAEHDITTGIVTARSKREVDEDVCLQSLVHHFKYIVCADDTEKHKPDPEPIQKLIKLANLENSNTLYIGDTYYDYMCAKNSGVHFGLALWGARTTEGIDAEYYFKTPTEIVDVLLKD
jgi:HAD superfamily hydrolase (TIGR01549 family)